MRHEQQQIQKTFVSTREEQPVQWYLFDASGKTLGRLASELAKILRGKHKPTFMTNVDVGDGIIVVNAEKIEVTGNKEAQKIYRHYTRHPGGMKECTLKVMRQKNPTFIVETAVTRMMPRTKLSRHQLKRLRIFAGQTHDMHAQKPITVNA